MTPEIEQAPTGYFRRPRLSPDGTNPQRLSPGDVRSLALPQSALPQSALPQSALPQPTRQQPALRQPELTRPELRQPGPQWPEPSAAAAPPNAAAPSAAASPNAAAPPNASAPATAPPAAVAPVDRLGRDAGGIVTVVPYLAVLLCAVIGVYVAWRQGSAGGGLGGVIGGVALLAAAAGRLLLPARLAGLLATRERLTDVLTLAVFGGALLVAGLVLPH